MPLRIPSDRAVTPSRLPEVRSGPQDGNTNGASAGGNTPIHQGNEVRTGSREQRGKRRSLTGIWSARRGCTLPPALHCTVMCAIAAAVPLAAEVPTGVLFGVPVANAMGLLVAPYVRLALPRTSLPKSVVSRMPITPNYYIILLQLFMLAYFGQCAEHGIPEPDSGDYSAGKAPVTSASVDKCMSAS
ncbi:transmembrane protein [Cystoisospora suis]|uniref:Transmembrane protein n=1 Tax=Cystoisospora suis TaxID=483139 RepID=A0A2C6KKI8_9APIC|nr:transmembrane protein [Cystoisospora suis]